MKPTILIVDDEEFIVKILSELFLERGFKVKSASNGVDALNIIKTHQAEIPLIITEIKIPLMDGYEMIENLPYILHQPIAVIIYSGCFSPFNHSHFRLGMLKNVLLYDILLKPTDQIPIFKIAEKAIELCLQHRTLQLEEMRNLYLQYN